MFLNYFKTAYRNLVRNKLYSTISILGLSIGIACCLLIYLYIEHEFSYDKFHAGVDNIYRIVRVVTDDGIESKRSAATAVPLQPALQKTFQEIINSTRIHSTTAAVGKDNISFSEEVTFVDPGFFKMFSFPLIYGEIDSIIDDPSSVVITPEIARKYFGDKNPVGEILSIQLAGTSFDYTVTGIVESPPSNSTMQYSLLVSTDRLKYTLPEWVMQNFNMKGIRTYISIHPETDVATFERRISDYIIGLTHDQDESFKLQPLIDIHIDSRYEDSADYAYFYILMSISFAVLLIACVNFLTLTIGRLGNRSREVGLRKVLGAGRFLIVKQFIGEAFLISFVALILAFALAELFLPTFTELVGKRLDLSLFSNLTHLPVFFAIIFLTAFLGGIYPALLLSRLHPVETLKGPLKIGGRNRFVQTLITIQFIIAVFMLAGTLVMSSQMDYVHMADLGYDKSMVVTFPTNSRDEHAENLLKRFRAEIQRHPSVIEVTGYSNGFGDPWLFVIPRRDGSWFIHSSTENIPIYEANEGEDYFFVNKVDRHFIPTIDIKITEGRNFDENHPSDQTKAIIVNQAMVKMKDWENPIGQKVSGFDEAMVIGVVEDFHFYSLHQRIEPLILHMFDFVSADNINEIAVRIKAENIPSTLVMLEETWTRISGGLPLNYSFIDDRVAKQYIEEDRWRKIIRFASITALLIACLGLFGLTSLAVAKRTREVGIRKVLGASVKSIVLMFSRDFIRLILIANIIAFPVGYYAMQSWLEEFAYRIDIIISFFIITAAISMGIAIITIAFQTVKAGLADPVKALRYE